ncbi:MAG: magnesium/cobalt transporter CorA [bacterium]|nr:MAG: magnesium/cobalt transporter CorA [bacterium]
MQNIIKKRSKKTGLPPGTLVHIGKRKVEKVKITYVQYDKTKFQEKEVQTLDECFPVKKKPVFTWINIDGLHQIEIIDKLGKQLNIHSLLLEDIVNTDQRPKIELFEDYLFIVMKMLYYNKKNKNIESEQIGFILNSNLVISFQEKETDVFDNIKERMKNSKSRIRQKGTDFLVYVLMDAIVDNYFIVLEKLEQEIELLDEELMINPKTEIFNSIHKLKREMIMMHRSIWPLREVISRLEKGEFSLIHESTIIYLRDVYDHIIQIIETNDIFREIVTDMLDTYLSSVSNRMNEIMKVLTMIATLFMPLTFIAGIYGMNFKYMPELEWRWGYFSIIFIMLVITTGMITYFRKKKWL